MSTYDNFLAHLSRHPCATNAEMALECGMTEAEVEAAIDHFKAEGTLLAYQAIFAAEKVPQPAVTAMVEVKITPERGGGFDRLSTRIARFAEVQSCYLVSGGYDLLVVVQGDTLNDVAKFISEKLSTIKGVLSTATRFRLKSYKENGIMLSQDQAPRRLAVAP